MEKVKIICTLGPASFSKPTLKLLSKEKVDIFRINLSHTNTDQIEKKMIQWNNNNFNVIIMFRCFVHHRSFINNYAALRWNRCFAASWRERVKSCRFAATCATFAAWACKSFMN